MRATQDTPGALDAWRPQPHPVSGILECPADLTFGQLVDAAQLSGWSTDGLHPEPADATIGQLLERRQPRPRHFCDGLLATRVCRVVVSRENTDGYVSLAAPRKASGPDLAYLFLGAEGCFGRIQRAAVALVRPAARYFHATGRFPEPQPLFAAARELALLDPLTTRHVDWPNRGLEAWVPLRGASQRPLEEALRELGLEVELTQAVPSEARLAAALPDGEKLVISGAYAWLAGLLEGEGDVRVHHSDAHGAAATITGERARLLELREAARNQAHWDDLWLEDETGVEGLAQALQLGTERT